MIANAEIAEPARVSLLLDQPVDIQQLRSHHRLQALEGGRTAGIAQRVLPLAREGEQTGILNLGGGENIDHADLLVRRWRSAIAVAVPQTAQRRLRNLFEQERNRRKHFVGQPHI